MKKTITLAAMTALASPAFAAISITDVTGLTGSQSVASTAQIDAEAGTTGGIDDTFTGTIQFDFTINQTTFASGSNFGGFQLYNSGGENLAVGSHFQATNWGGFGGPAGAGDYTLNGTGGTPDAIVEGEAQTFKMVIDYVVGGDDTATITFNGTDNVLVGDWSFDEVQVRSGNAPNVDDFTNMSITAVPEPSSAALLGLGGLALILRRRK